jgi:chromosome segregation ATPase
MQQNFSQQINELKESRQHEIQAAVDDALVGKIIEIKSMKENFDSHLQELKVSQQQEIQAAVSKITEARQLDVIQGQGQTIEFKASMNTVQALSEEYKTEIEQSKIRYEKLAEDHHEELRKQNARHEQEMLRAQQKLEQQEETFQQHITTLTDEMTQLKQMFAQLMSSNASTTATATETPPRDNKRQRPSATPPSAKDQDKAMESTVSDMDHQPVADDEALPTANELQDESALSTDVNQPKTMVLSQSDPANPPTLGTLKEYEQHGA